MIRTLILTKTSRFQVVISAIPDSQESFIEVTLFAGEQVRKTLGKLLVEKRKSTTSQAPTKNPEESETQPVKVDKSPKKPVEVGGQKGPEQTRYGDLEKAGRCTDF